MRRCLCAAHFAYAQEVGGSWFRDVSEDGSERRERFRPRVEGAFARIERVTDKTTWETHWRATTKDNVTNVYGQTAQARISDPEARTPSGRVFRWLLERTYDDKGNVVLYEYKTEDLVSVPQRLHERHRHDGMSAPVNRHLKRILYGNLAGQADPLLPEHFHFEVVFDYGEHDPTAPAPDDAGDWLARQDPFSTYRAGFEIRTYRLCRRILMFHRFTVELGNDPASSCRCWPSPRRPCTYSSPSSSVAGRARRTSSSTKTSYGVKRGLRSRNRMRS